VRCDVVVRGPRLDEALAQFAALLTADLQELDAVPVYLVQGLRFVDAFGELCCRVWPASGWLVSLAAGVSCVAGGLITNSLCCQLQGS